MPLKWTDIYDIAIDLEDAHPHADIARIAFTDLWKKVLDLDQFCDEPKNSSEKVLEAIQAAWLDERD